MEITTRRAYRKRKRIWKRIIRAFVLFGIIALGCIGAVIAYAYQMEPPSLSVAETTVIYSADGEVIGEFYDGQYRHWIPLEQMGDAIVEATLAVEDRRFYEHYGFDFFRIGGAVITNLKTNSMAQGASTITQQYARNLFLNHEKTWSRKWNEAFFAMRLELHYSKHDILEGYLNTIYYGHGAYGIEAAANIYFQKNAEDLTKAEAALLAGIPKGPSYYSPFVDMENAKQRQEVVLQTMEDAGYITSSERAVLADEPLHFSQDDKVEAKKTAPYFQDTVMEWLEEELKIDRDILETGGLEIHTTLDSRLQQIADKWIAEQITPDNELQAAFVAMNPQTGEVKAMIGGTNYEESPFNRATKARRQPGSTMKPFLYYAALEQGLRPNSMLKSEETTFLYDNGSKEYEPKNFGGYYADDYITMLEALAVSDNIYAMKTHFLLGFDKLVETAKRFGIESPLSAVPALALGASDVGILEMTNSYSAFANGGYQVTPHFVSKIIDRDGKILFEADFEKTPAVDPGLTAVMTDIMKAMFEPELNEESYTVVTGGSVADYFDRPVAGKSGSTPYDSWMIGFTPQLLTGVWAGFDQDKTLDRVDNQHSKIIWARFMEEALQDELKLEFPVPDNVVEVVINPYNGKLATEDCTVKRPTLFIEGTEPTEYCTVHPEGASEEDWDPLQMPEEEKKEKWMDRIFDWFS
ncbi:penicillin-binding protein, 1A family [Evansella caseinilytica]|uniref:Penicillin-binding protein, 1A family n=1 Tax=Evansella caseinilytica TaxID=1503961 RepID=A0A1H3T2J7_9BACI|nr:PBP1A family penicillin-binding protein [Evansella caseinilytica]SDZ44496.1 penicillin-binding protein, 1A family [Evansella caseinilytica]